MGYDFYLFDGAREFSRQDPLDVFLAEAQENIGDPVPDKELRKRNLLRALTANLGFQWQEPDFAALARAEGTSESEAMRRHRTTRLVSAKSGSPMEVSIFDDLVLVVLSWSSREKRAGAVSAALKTLEVLRDYSGFVIYDIQCLKRVDPQADASMILTAYQEGCELAHQVSKRPL